VQGVLVQEVVPEPRIKAKHVPRADLTGEGDAS
jgi:hypothetical protein